MNLFEKLQFYNFAVDLYLDVFQEVFFNGNKDACSKVKTKFMHYVVVDDLSPTQNTLVTIIVHLTTRKQYFCILILKIGIESVCIKNV